MQAPWLLMIETDYVWMKPMQAPQAEDIAASSLAFPFGYINPQHPHVEGVMRKMYPAEKGPLTNVPGSGPAPVMMRLAEWIKVSQPADLIVLSPKECDRGKGAFRVSGGARGVCRGGASLP